MIYAIFVSLCVLNLASLAVIYRLVMKVMSYNFRVNNIQEDPFKITARSEKTKGHKPAHEEFIPIDEVDPEKIMQALAEQSGRGDEYKGYQPGGSFTETEI